MLFKAPLACEQAVYSRHILASANHRDFLMELAFQVIYISLCATRCRRIYDFAVPRFSHACTSVEFYGKYTKSYFNTNIQYYGKHAFRSKIVAVSEKKLVCVLRYPGQLLFMNFCEPMQS